MRFVVATHKTEGAISISIAMKNRHTTRATRVGFPARRARWTTRALIGIGFLSVEPPESDTAPTFCHLLDVVNQVNI